MFIMKLIFNFIPKFDGSFFWGKCKAKCGIETRDLKGVSGWVGVWEVYVGGTQTWSFGTLSLFCLFMTTSPLVSKQYMLKSVSSYAWYVILHSKVR